MTRLFRIPCLHPDAPSGAPTSEPARPAVPPVSSAQKQQTLVDRLLNRYGSPEAALAYLASTNVTQEETIERLSRENADYARRLPEGAVVIPKAEVEGLNQIRALNLKPEEIARAVKERDEFKVKDETRTKGDHARALAKASGMDEDAFVEHFLAKNLDGELRDVTTEDRAGKKTTVKQAFLRADSKQPFAAAKDYLATLQPHEQRALTPSTAPAQGGAPATGPSYPSTGPTAPAGTGTGAKGALDRYLQKRNEQAAAAPNPLHRTPVTPRTPAPAPAGSAS